MSPKQLYKQAYSDARYVANYESPEDDGRLADDVYHHWIGKDWRFYVAALSTHVNSTYAPRYHWKNFSRFLRFHNRYKQ